MEKVQSTVKKNERRPGEESEEFVLVKLTQMISHGFFENKRKEENSMCPFNC